MLAEKRALIRREVEEGTGAEICLEEDRWGVQTALRLWFADLERNHSPIVTLRPTGLRRFEVKLAFGNFAADTVRQMQQACDEDLQLARALLTSLSASASLKIGDGQSVDSWHIDSGRFTIVAEKRDIASRYEDDSIVDTCRELVIPILAAMAELYGYDPIEVSGPSDQDALTEGNVKLSIIRRRERNPRNRLLCLRIHGPICKICNFDPTNFYRDVGNIIEVHHLQPLSVAGGPRPYNPATDLIPLCPNCHRAVHTRRPIPWTPAELRVQLSHE